MPLQVKISARAAREVRQAAEWWRVNRPAAPGAVGNDFSQAVSLLAEYPGVGAKTAGNRLPDLRRLYLNRLGYFIYYTADAHALKLLAFWHASRGAQPRL